MYRVIEPEELKIDITLGYTYFLDKEHPLASKEVGKVYYHRHIASIKIGRWLSSTEIVHHVDGNKQNNLEDNLLVMSSSDHALLHAIENGFDNLYQILTCPVCKNTFTVTNKASETRVTCSLVCARKKSIQWNISKDKLEVLIWNMSFTDIAKAYPISDTGAKKKAKALGCTMPPPYFFNKSETYRQQQRKLNNIPDLLL